MRTEVRLTRSIRLGRPRWLVAAVLALLAVACGGDDAVAVTAASTVAPAETATSVATTSVATTTTEATTTITEATTTITKASKTTSAVSDEQIAAAAAVGDIAAGEELFNAAVDGVPHSVSCSSCHTLDGIDGRAPTLAGISAVAADRVDGMSDVDYLRQSIVDPYVFKVDGEWLSAAMPYQYPNLFSEEQIDNLIAFLLTR